MMSVEVVALEQVEEQLRLRDFVPTRQARNCSKGDIHAQRGKRHIRIEVKGLAERNGVWLTTRQVSAVDIVVIYVIEGEEVWVLSPREAHDLLDAYQKDFIERRGRSPKAQGFNGSQFPKPTGWSALDRLISDSN